VGNKLNELAVGAPNNFRIMRFVAASAVILSHGFMLNGGAAAIADDPLRRITGIDSGILAVDVFFVISGFLVSRSLMRRCDIKDFVAARVLRIWPGLGVAVALTALALGPLVTDLPLRQYFATRWVYSYIVIDGLSLSPFHFRYQLPGVFEHLPMAGVVNAPLWSLPWEIWMYISLLTLHMVRGLGRPFPAILGLILIAYAIMTFGHWPATAYPATAARLLAFFFCGVAMQRYAHRISISLPIFAATSALFAVVSIATQSAILLPAWLAYAVLVVAYEPRLVVSRWSHGADFSYGMYIYAYMVQQTLVWAIGPHDPWLNAGLALVVTLPLAAASWYIIERPMLSLKAKLRSR
jgi:peptidoglycan/LPS O-acetylase OafA/YrhL